MGMDFARAVGFELHRRKKRIPLEIRSIGQREALAVGIERRRIVQGHSPATAPLFQILDSASHAARVSIFAL